MKRAVLVACLCALSAFAIAQTFPSPGPGRAPWGEPPEILVALVPDTQNYCTSEVSPLVPGSPTPAETAEGPRVLDILAADVIALGPAFVVQVGDIADQQSTVGDDATDLDNFTAFPLRYAEGPCVKTHLFDKLTAAGIPWIATSGNHDSYRDFERAFTRAAFLATSYDFNAQNEVDRWHAGFNDTEERAALFSTLIGSLCVVTVDYVNTATLDQSFVNTNTGCGASHPTIYVPHNGVSSGGTAPPFAQAGNSEVFMQMRGHLTPPGLGPFQTAALVAAPGGFQYADIFSNSQEQSLDCGAGTHDDGTSQHTGTGWWTTVLIVPSSNSITVTARDSLRGGATGPSPCGWTYDNMTLNPSPTLCTRFPALVGC